MERQCTIKHLRQTGTWTSMKSWNISRTTPHKDCLEAAKKRPTGEKSLKNRAETEFWLVSYGAGRLKPL